MSYSSESKLPTTARIADVREYIELLGYKKLHGWKKVGTVSFEGFAWYDEIDYRSWSGVELSIDKFANGRLSVSTRTPISRSYYDLTQQNRTILALRKRFGGTFRTDEGRGRCMRPNSAPPPPAASGCHLAFGIFGHNLIRALHYSDKAFENEPLPKGSDVLVQLGLHPQTLSGNMLTSFAVSIVEDYLKSCFIALLKYSPQKEAILRGVRLRGDQLARVSNGEVGIENAVAETFSFQRISLACKSFESIDKKLDIAGALRKPFKGKSRTFFDVLEELVDKRNEFVHRARLDNDLTTGSVKQILYDLDVAMTRVQLTITDRYGWPYDKTWSVSVAESEA